MLEKKLIQNLGLKDGEKTENLIRRSLWCWFWPITGGIFLIALAFFLIYPLFRWGISGVIFFALIIILGFGMLLRSYWSYYFTVFCLTNFRIIDLEQGGFFNHLATGVLYSQIQEVNYRASGLLHALRRTGDVYLSFVGNQKIKIKLKKVKQPQKVVSEILARQEAALRPNVFPAQQAGFLLAKIKNKIGEEAFKKLIAD